MLHLRCTCSHILTVYPSNHKCQRWHRPDHVSECGKYGLRSDAVQHLVSKWNTKHRAEEGNAHHCWTNGVDAIATKLKKEGLTKGRRRENRLSSSPS